MCGPIGCFPKEENKRGLFISFEGGDGSGKSTQLECFEGYLSRRGIEYMHVREPGQTKIGEEIRDLLLNRKEIEMTVLTEVFLFNAARSELVTQVIKPVIESGGFIVSDRFYDATLVYQALAGNTGLSYDSVRDICLSACQGISPDRTYLFDVRTEVAIGRRIGRIDDRMESKGREFHERVREGYLELARTNPRRIMVVDANSNEINGIHKKVIEDFEKYYQNP